MKKQCAKCRLSVMCLPVGVERFAFSFRYCVGCGSLLRERAILRAGRRDFIVGGTEINCNEGCEMLWKAVRKHGGCFHDSRCIVCQNKKWKGEGDVFARYADL